MSKTTTVGALLEKKIHLPQHKYNNTLLEIEKLQGVVQQQEKTIKQKDTLLEILTLEKEVRTEEIFLLVSHNRIQVEIENNSNNFGF